MLGSARPEKDVKLTGEFDSSLRSVYRRVVFDTRIEDADLEVGSTEKQD